VCLQVTSVRVINLFFSAKLPKLIKTKLFGVKLDVARKKVGQASFLLSIVCTSLSFVCWQPFALLYNYQQVFHAIAENIERVLVSR
jgi:hypothetical protein